MVCVCFGSQMSHSMNAIMENQSHLIKDLKCEQFTKFYKLVESCGLLAQVSKAGFATVDSTQQTSPPSLANAEKPN